MLFRSPWALTFCPKMRLRTTQETGTLDACIERMISLSSSWKIHFERYDLKMTGVLSVKLQCSCALFTGEAMLCHRPE